jgi:branched-chain amino acid transport system substrate-binding protein
MRRPSAKTFRLVALTAASAAVAACGLSSANNNTLLAGPSGQPITVGISEPLSGPAQAQGFAADGQACLRGYKLWASDVNSHGGLLGRPVKLVVMNDRGWPASTAYDYKWLITHDHVDLTLAPFSSLLTAQGAAPATDKLHYALVAGSAGAPSVFSPPHHNLFSTTIPAANEMVPFANWVLHLPGHPTTAAYPMVSDPFADPPVTTTRLAFEHRGITTVYKTGPNGYTNTKPSALAADAKLVARRNPGIVVLGSVDVPTVAAFMHEWGVLHWTPKILIGAGGPDQGQQFLNAAGIGNAIGVMVPNGWYGGSPEALSHVMVQNYIARYGGTASTINGDVAESYSAGQALQAAVEATHGTVQSDLINWLHNPKHTVQTVLGPAQFNAVGENVDAAKSAVIFQWQPGAGGTGAKFVQVLPPPPHPGSVPIIATKSALSG